MKMEFDVKERRWTDKTHLKRAVQDEITLGEMGPHLPEDELERLAQKLVDDDKSAGTKFKEWASSLGRLALLPVREVTEMARDTLGPMAYPKYGADGQELTREQRTLANREKISAQWGKDIDDLKTVWNGSMTVLDTAAEVGQSAMQLTQDIPIVGGVAKAGLQLEEALGTVSDFTIDPVLGWFGKDTEKTLHGKEREDREDEKAMATVTDIKSLLSGEATVPETARLLKLRFEGREGFQQLVAGVVFDPLLGVGRAGKFTGKAVKFAKDIGLDTDVVERLPATWTSLIKRPGGDDFGKVSLDELFDLTATNTREGFEAGATAAREGIETGSTVQWENFAGKKMTWVVDEAGVWQTDLPGKSNVSRISKGVVTARGADAIGSRLSLETAKGVSAKAAGRAVSGASEVAADVQPVYQRLMKALPKAFLDDVSLSLRKRGLSSGESDVGGSFVAETALLTMMTDTAKGGSGAYKIFLHEIGHHLERFIPADDYKRLVRDWRATKRASKATTPENKDFSEFWASTFSNEASRYLFGIKNGPVAQNALEKTWLILRDLAASTVDFVKRRGIKREGEGITRQFLTGRYDATVYQTGVGKPTRKFSKNAEDGDSLLSGDSFLDMRSRKDYTENAVKRGEKSEYLKKVEARVLEDEAQGTLPSSRGFLERIIQGAGSEREKLVAEVQSKTKGVDDLLGRISRTKTENIVKSVKDGGTGLTGRLRKQWQNKFGQFSAEDAAIITIMRATGSRTGHAINISVGSVRRYLSREQDGLEFGLMSSKVIRPEDIGQYTAITPIRPSHDSAVRSALQKYITDNDSAKRLIDSGNDEAKFFTVAKDGAEASKKSYARKLFNDRYKTYIKGTDAPAVPKLMRRQVAMELLIETGGDVLNIQRQLGHADQWTTRKFYLRELGMLLDQKDDQLLDAVRGMFNGSDNQVDALENIRKWVGGGSKGNRRKGMTFSGGALGAAVHSIGSSLQEMVAVAPTTLEAIRLAPKMLPFVDDDLITYQALALARAKAEGLYRLSERMSSVHLSLGDQRSIIKKLRDKAKKDGDTELYENYKKTHADLTKRWEDASAIAKITSARVDTENGRIARNSYLLKQKYGDVTELNILTTAIGQPSQVYVEGQKNLSHIKTNQAKRRKFVKNLNKTETYKLMDTLDLSQSQSAKEIVGKWLDDVPIFEYLRDTGHITAHMDTAEILSRLRQVAKNQPLLMGPGYGELSKKARNARLGHIAATMFIDRDRMDKFVGAVGEIADDIPTDNPTIPKTEPRPNPHEKAAPSPEDMGVEEWDVARNPSQSIGDMLHLADSERLMSANSGKSVDFVQSAKMGSGSVRFIWTQIAGGWGPVLNSTGRSIAAMLDGFTRAHTKGMFARDSLKREFEAAGIRVERNDEIPGSSLFISEDSIRVRKVLPNLEARLEGFSGRGTLNQHMRSMHMLLGEIHPEKWDEFYIMSNKVKRALLFGRHQIKEMEDMFESARNLYGFDVEEFLKGDRVETYWPRIAVGKVMEGTHEETQIWNKVTKGRLWGTRQVKNAEIKLMSPDTSTTVQQSRPTNFMERQHEHYSGAVRDFTKYADEFESLGYYVENAHMMILEHQMKLRIMEQGHVIDIAGSGSGSSSAGAAVAILKQLIKGEVPTEALLTASYKLNGREWMEGAMRNPKDYLRRAEKNEAEARNLDFTNLGLKQSMSTQDIEVAWFNDLVLDKETRTQFRALMKPEIGPENTPGRIILAIGKGLSPITQMLRTLKSGFDLGVGLLHLFPVLVTRPALWARSQQKMWETLRNPDVYRQWRVENMDDILEAQSRGVVFGQAEPLETFDKGEKLARMFRDTTRAIEKRGKEILKKEENLLDASSQVGLLERFEAVFAMPLDYARLNMYQSYKQIYKGDDAALNAASAMVNKMTGTYNAQLAGVTPNMKAVQTGLLFFAPMYRRASYGLMAEMFKGGVRAKIAQKALGHMALAGAGAAYVAGLMAFTIKNGRPPMSPKDFLSPLPVVGEDFAGSMADPRTPSFMSVQIQDYQLGIGSAFYSVMRLGAVLVGTGKKLVTGDTQDLDEVLDFRSWPDNKMFRFFRAQLAPTTAIFMDLAVTGKDYIGTPITRGEGAGWAALGKYALHAPAPFWLSLDNITKIHRGGWAGTIGEMVGMRSYPISVLSKAMEVRDDIIEFEMTVNPEFRTLISTMTEEMGSVPKWSDLSRHWKEQLADKHTQLKDIDELVREYDMQFGNKLDREFVKFASLKRGHRKELSEAIKLALQELRDPRASQGAAVFQQKLRAAKSIFRAKGRELFEMFPSVFAKLEESRTRKTAEGKRYSLELAYEDYITSVVLHEDNEDEYGNFRPETYEKNLKAWEGRWGNDPDVKKYVENERYAGKNIPEEIRHFEVELRPQLEDYWNLHKKLPTAEKDIIDDFLEYKGPIKEQYAQSNRYIAGVIRRWQASRLRYRVRNPDVDWILVQWYGYSPRSQATLNKYNEQVLKPLGLNPLLSFAGKKAPADGGGGFTSFTSFGS
jgi:integrase